MLPLLQIGPLAIQTPGLILLIGLWVGLALSEKVAPHRGLSGNSVNNLVILSLLAGLVGGRLLFVLRFPEAFAQDWLSLFSLIPGLLHPGDALLCALLIGWVYCTRRNLPIPEILDVLTPLLATTAVAIGLANLASGAGFGETTNLPSGIELWGAKRHPSQLYETSAALLILVWLWLQRTQLQKIKPGFFFLAFSTLSAGTRLFLEAYRADNPLLPGGFRLMQVLAWLVLIAGLIIFSRAENQKKNET